MKVLFDQGTPVPLRRALTGHEVRTAYEMGWSTMTMRTRKESPSMAER